MSYQCEQPKNESELRAVLALYDVDPSIWKKTCGNLCEELSNGESYLEVDGAGVLSRVVRIANVVITSITGETLRESHQVLPDGTTKNKKNGNLTEKVGQVETALGGIIRGIQEELGSTMGAYVGNIRPNGPEGVEYKPSDSFNGFTCVYKVNRFTADWSGPVEDFSTIDAHDGKRIFWVWK